MESLKKHSNNRLINHKNSTKDLEHFLSQQLKESQIIQEQIDALLTKVSNQQELIRTFLNQHIEQLNLPRRVYVGLVINSIDTVDDLISWTPKKLLKLPMIGHTAVAEIQKGLQKVGLKLT